MFLTRRCKVVTACLLSPALFVLLLAVPAPAKTVTYVPQTVYFTYCFSHPPAARIASGDTVVTKTRDASNDAFKPTDKTLAAGNLDLSRVNPQTGPFYVEGAEPGDTHRSPRSPARRSTSANTKRNTCSSASAPSGSPRPASASSRIGNGLCSRPSAWTRLSRSSARRAANTRSSSSSCLPSTG